MGGWANAFSNLAREGVEKVASKFVASPTAQKLGEKVEAGMYHAIFKPEAAFQDIPAAKKLWGAYSGPYHELSSKFESEGVQLSKRTGLNRPASEISSEARKKASDVVFGPNREVIQGVLKHVENTVSKNRADILADHLNILLHEAPMESGRNRGLSQLDVDLAKKGAAGSRFEGPISKYKRPNTVEKIAGIHQRTLAYKAAIPHLASNLNILMSDGFVTYGKSLVQTFGPGRKAAEAQVLATNAISELVMNSYKEKQAFEAGIIKQYAPGSVGEFIHRNMYIPGMDRVRYNTLMMSAHASLLAAKEAAYHLQSGDTKFALPMLQELGLDASKIAAQKGQLLPEDIAKAYYHGTNVRAFLQQGDKRTILGQRSPMFRIMGAFHKYVSNQASFMRNVFKRQYEQGDFVGIARNIGLISMAFPVVGTSIYESERILSGNDWDDPTGHLENRLEATPAGMLYDKVAGRENAVSSAKMTLNTLDSLSHMASFGVATGYIRGASRANLAGQILGPDANMTIQGVQDAWKAVHTDNNHPDAWKYLGRDIMSDTPSLGLGSIASHKLLPTKAEEAKKKFHKFRRPHPKPDSWNPLNSDDFKY